MPDRKKFSEVFGDKDDRPRPEVTLRRFTDEDWKKYGHILRPGHTVGIFWGRDLLAVVDFDDLFDEDGNRFHND